MKQYFLQNSVGSNSFQFGTHIDFKETSQIAFFFNYKKYKSIEGVWKHAVIPYPEKNHEHGVNLVVFVTPTSFQKILTDLFTFEGYGVI